MLLFARLSCVSLQIKITNSQSKQQELSNLLGGLDGSAIIYVITKKEAEELTAEVRQCLM